MNPFDADTALTEAGERRWRADVPAHWSTDGAAVSVNGGFFAALCARAAGLVAGAPPRSLTIHYLAAPAVEEVVLTATVTRQGRSTTFLQLALEQHGEPMAAAMAVCAPWRDDAPEFADSAPPPLPAVEECHPVEPGGIVPPLVGNYELRVAGDATGRPARVGGWIRTAQPRPSDHVALAAMTDAFFPPAILRAGEAVAVPTLELTIHFRGLPPEGEHPWIRAAFTTRVAAGGLCEEDGELWSADGVLLAQSRQLALIRRPRA